MSRPIVPARAAYAANRAGLPALLAAALLGADALAQQAPQRVLEVFQREVLHTRRNSDLPPFGTLLPSPADGLYRLDLLGDAGNGEPRTSELPVRFLEIAHQDDFDNEGMAYDASERLLQLEARPELMQQLRGELAALDAITGRRIELRAALYELPDGAAAATVLAPETDARRGRLLWESRAAAKHGATVTFDAMKWTRYVQQINVEVAQKQSISNPVVAVFGEGPCVAVSAHALVDSDDVALFVQFACGTLERLETVVTGVPEQPNLDQPLLATTFGAASARVTSGGAMQVAVGGATGGAPLLLVIEPRYTSPRAAAEIHGVALLPMTAMTSSALRQRRPFPDPRSHMLDNYEASFGGDDGDSPLDPDQLAEIVRRAIAQEEASVEPCDGFLLVRADAAARQRGATALTHLQDQLLRNVSVRCTAVLDEASGPETFAAVQVDGQGRALNLHDVALPSLPGRVATLWRGREAMAISTMVPEIAQEAAIAAPVVNLRQSGLWLRFAPPTGPSGDTFDLDAQLDQQEMAPARSLGTGGLLQLGQCASLRARRIHALPADTDTTVARGVTMRLDGRWWRPSLVVRRSEDAAGAVR
ncbi:MAG: hypothetical protein AB7O97_13410 [Planctomycetota bacterium]